MALLKGKKLMWAKLSGMGEKKYGSELTQWSLNAVVSDQESRKWVKAGYAQKERFQEIDGEEATCIFLKRDTHYKSGDEKTAPRVVDMYGMDVDPSTIGNGTVANIQYNVREWEFEGRKGKSPELLAVQIVELVEYKSGGGGMSNEFEFMTKEGDTSFDDDVDFGDDEFE